MRVSCHKPREQKLFKTLDAEKDGRNDGEGGEKQIWQAASDELLHLRVRKQESCS